jgi:hypothetical protein
MRTALVTCALALLVRPCLADAPTETPREQPNMGRLAHELAQKLGEGLVRHGPRDRSEKFRVAVFPFGNSKGKYTLAMGDNGPVLRGALCDELRTFLDRKAPGKFLVLYPEQVDDQISAGSTDPTGISPRNPGLARKLLKVLDFQVGIVGRFEAEDFEDLFRVQLRPAGLAAPQAKGVKVQATAILPGDAIEVAGAVSRSDVINLGFGGQQQLSKQVGARFFVKMDADRPDSDNSAWKPMPLYASPEKDAAGKLYLLVPRSYRGKRYKVVLNNKDTERLVSAALLIDGVNSFMRHDGQRYRGVSGYPRSLQKWVLTPVGKKLVADRKGMPGRIEGARLESTSGLGGSEAHVRGFQRGREAAGSFVFASAAESVAVAELMSVRKIGTISLYFFAEKPRDTSADIASSKAPEVFPETAPKVGRDPDRTFGSAAPPPPKESPRPPVKSALPGSPAIPAPGGGSRPDGGERVIAPKTGTPDSPPATAKMSKTVPLKSAAPKKKEVELPGTKIGKSVESRTFRVRVLNWPEAPTAVWHIVYRYDDDPTLPAGLKPIP